MTEKRTDSNFENESVKIVDEGYTLEVYNKLTGKSVLAICYNGLKHGKMYMTLNYEGKPADFNHQECCKAAARTFALKHLGLPTFQTLLKKQNK